MRSNTKILKYIQFTEQLAFVKAIRSGLVNIIPILIIGAFALILQTFPLQGYQNFITNVANGFVLNVIKYIYSATFGVLSVYMTYSISRAYMDIKSDKDVVAIGAPLAALLSFAILAGAYLPEFNTDSLGPKSMFLAIIAGLGASALYLKLNLVISNKFKRALFSTGADRIFNRMLSTFFPIVIIAILVAVINAAINRIFDVESFRAFLIRAFSSLFSGNNRGFLKGLLFVFLSSLLWFFGIHGSNTLEDVMQAYFAPGLSENQTAIANGMEPTSILTKEFFDCFVLMGGCGATICLLIAILVISKNRARKSLGVAAAFPMIFNINELMVFGLPIILNPTMLIPFICVPLVSYSISYLAISSGLVPMITSEVAWTTPIILGGFTATGSLAGSLLQLLDVLIGVLIYSPFVKMLDKQSENDAKYNFESFMKFFKDNEQKLGAIKLIELDNEFGQFAKALCAEMQYNINEQTKIAYQPQYNYDNKCIGAESLLRWTHPIHGVIYPPLVIKLAEEGGFLLDLEELVLTKVLNDYQDVLDKFGNDIKVSVNVTGTNIVNIKFLKFCNQLNAKYDFSNKNICLEVTEQATVDFNRETLNTINGLRELGFKLAIDDFSMGQTSIHYLKDNIFDIIKLDGLIIKEMFNHENNKEIIASIIQLATSLNMMVIAEFVETSEQKEALHNMGCDNYQGYLYSPAVFLK